MTDAEATEWLTVAAREVAEYPADIVAEGCKRVRRSATHHAQIVPALVEHCEEAVTVRRFLARRAERAAPALPRPRAASRPMTQREIDKLPGYIKRVGIACGALVECPDGRVRWAP